MGKSNLHAAFPHVDKCAFLVLGKEKGPRGPFDVVVRRSSPSYQRAGGDPITFTRVFDLSRMAFSPSNAVKNGDTVSTAQRQRGREGKI